MKKLLLYLVITLLITNLTRSQTGTVSGVVADTGEQKSLTNAVTAVPRKSDSLLPGFTRNDKSVNFIISVIYNFNMSGNRDNHQQQKIYAIIKPTSVNRSVCI